MTKPQMDSYFLDCLRNPWIFNSVAEFQRSVQDGGIIEYDGSGTLLFVDKKTGKLEKGESCFCDGINVWKKTKQEEKRGDFPDATIIRIINHFSNKQRQLIGVLWYNQ